jgi:anti-sigma regulatory factor (Ser/Thr protein kinase)
MTSTAARPRRVGYPGYSMSCDRDPRTARTARALTRVTMAVWGLDKDTDTAALLLSELVANAVRWGSGTRLRMSVDRPANDTVRLAVVDRAPRGLPELLAPAQEDVRGRGLFLVDAMADRWGYDLVGLASRPWGKRTWAELQTTP